jgi:glycosyltransferase involved in cell wall biosynthesis
MLERGVEVSYLLDDLPYNRSLELHPKARRLYVANPKSVSQLLTRRRVLREAAPDYVHICSVSPKAYLALVGTDQKLVGDWDEWPARRPYRPLKKRVATTVDAWLRGRADLCVVASRYMQRAFREDYGIEPLYLPHASFMPSYPDGVSPFSAPTAVYMGNFYPVYDQDILFEAAAILKQRGLTPQIEMIAGGTDLARWRRFVEERGLTNVTMAGYLTGEELWRHLRHAHVLLFPLRYSEVNACRCPGKIFFYAQARRPVITTSVGEIPEVLKEKATYVSCTAEDFADAIAEAMSHPVLPDVDYDLDSWDARAQSLLDALHERRERTTILAPSAGVVANADRKGLA